ncbi:MAG: hypothetical protein ACKVQK_13175 [Burkholderiales bacterium]
MTDSLILTAKDFRPLREDASHMLGAIDAVAKAVAVQHQARLRHQHLFDIAPGETDGLRLSVSAEDGARSGMRVFGNPPHTRAYLLFDVATRALIATMDYGVLNSLRVGATTSYAVRHLAPANTRVLGFIGSGWQAQPQLDGLKKALPSLEKIRLYSPTKEKREAFAKAMSARIGIPIEPVESTQAAMAGADVVDLCAPGHSALREPLFEPSWVKPGALVVALAPNQCPIDFVRQARVVAVSWDALLHPESWPPFDQLIGSGELTQDKITTLGAVIEGTKPRRSPEERVVYYLEGASAADLYVASWAYDWAKSQGLGKHFDLRE